MFWADVSDAAVAEEAESLFFNYMDPADTSADDEAASKQVGIKLDRIRQGEPLGDIEPGLEAGVRFFVLGARPQCGEAVGSVLFRGYVRAIDPQLSAVSRRHGD